VDVLADRYLLCLAGRDERTLKSMTTELPDAFYWQVDLATADGVDLVPIELHAVDLLVHCAGVFDRDEIIETRDGAWQDVFAVNLFGVVDVTRNLLPALRAARGRVIVVNSTVVAGSPARRSAYAASKHALRVFAQALGEEEKANGVQVTSVYPGRVATEMQRVVRRFEGGPFETERYLAPESVASAVSFAASAPPGTHLAELVLEPGAGYGSARPGSNGAW
jgi:NAD(P)-dependent dehydrogenase (short-subunit alcohol dehydrogenase family)